jgi:hypothetical protein
VSGRGVAELARNATTVARASPRYAEITHQCVQTTSSSFTFLSMSRPSSRMNHNVVAYGQVWTIERKKELGIVDHITREQAITIAHAWIHNQEVVIIFFNFFFYYSGSKRRLSVDPERKRKKKMNQDLGATRLSFSSSQLSDH